MAVDKKQYRITWSERGERGEDEPETVTAFVYITHGDFFAFYEANPEFTPAKLLVRTSDVQEIRQVEADNG